MMQSKINLQVEENTLHTTREVWNDFYNLGNSQVRIECGI